VEKAGDVPIVIDLRTLGSNNSIYADRSVEAHARATRLIRDLLTAIYEELLEKITHPKSALNTDGMDQAIDALAGCVKSVVATSEQQDRNKGTKADELEVQADVSGKISLAGPEVAAAAKANERFQERDE
jgi:hypothetical protein